VQRTLKTKQTHKKLNKKKTKLKKLLRDNEHTQLMKEEKLMMNREKFKSHLIIVIIIMIIIIKIIMINIK